jgi:cell division protein FtsB
VVYDAEIVRLVKEVEVLKASQKKLEADMADIRNEQ